MAKSALRLTALRLGTTLMPRVVTIMITRMRMVTITARTAMLMLTMLTVTTAVSRTNRLGL
jgi:Mg2+/Co2+ transporter CorC